MNPRVVEAIERLEKFISTVDDAWALPREGSRFCRAVILATGARHGVEIGTGYGYSGLWIASALAENGGRLTTIDHDPRKREAAHAVYAAAGLAEMVDFRDGQALDVLASLPAPIDFVLNDADKEHCTRYVELLVPKLSDRAVVLTDNIQTHAAQLAEFLAWIRHRSDFFSTSVPVGNGMELSIKLASG